MKKKDKIIIALAVAFLVSIWMIDSRYLLSISFRVNQDTAFNLLGFHMSIGWIWNWLAGPILSILLAIFFADEIQSIRKQKKEKGYLYYAQKLAYFGVLCGTILALLTLGLNMIPFNGSNWFPRLLSNNYGYWYLLIVFIIPMIISAIFTKPFKTKVLSDFLYFLSSSVIASFFIIPIFWGVLYLIPGIVITCFLLLVSHIFFRIEEEELNYEI